MREPEFFVLSEHSVKYYEKLAEDGEEVYIDTLSYEEFMMLDEWDVQHRFTEMAEQEDKEQYYSDAGAEVIYEMEPGDSISYRMLHMGFTKEQKTEVMRMRELRREYGHNEM